MALITDKPEPNIWNEICKDFAKRRPPFEDDEVSVTTDIHEFDPAKVTPVLYGKMHAKVDTDLNPLDDFDPARSHPACAGLALLSRPPETPPPPPRTPPNKKQCLPREFLEHYIFPVLLPAMEEMLKQAKLEKCFERKRTKFNACDFLTEYLYRNNTHHEGRESTELLEIPFVQEWLKEHPRPPLPKSLLWTEEEATLIIQSFWRGYKVRREPDVQELRQWQREWREENENISQKVSDFWDKKMPDGCDLDTPQASVEDLATRSAPTLVIQNESSAEDLAVEASQEEVSQEAREPAQPESQEEGPDQGYIQEDQNKEELINTEYNEENPADSEDVTDAAKIDTEYEKEPEMLT